MKSPAFTLVSCHLSQIGDWKMRERAEDAFAPSHHIFACLSPFEPPVEILSLNNCNQHIPASRTHARVRARIAKYLTSKRSKRKCRSSHDSSDVRLGLKWVLFVLFKEREKQHLTSVDSQALSVVCSLDGFVRRRKGRFC